MKNILRKIKAVSSIYHFLLAFLGACYYRFPSKKIKVYGVTGTNGKTTTVTLAGEILKQAGYKVAVLSSVSFEIAGEEETNLYKMTMPGRAVLQKLLRKAVNKGCQVAVLEATSEGVNQHRHRFIDFNAVAITNITPEHIESHGSFEKYREAKGKLFKSCKKTHIINQDDDNAPYFKQFKSKKKILFGIKKETVENTTLFAHNIISKESGVSFAVGDTDYYLNMQGEFNVYNSLLAMAIAQEEGVSKESIKKALSQVRGVPGRMEKVVSSPFTVLIDYAVTPDAFENLYRDVKEKWPVKRIISVFGACGGGRDKWKRPVLGELADRYSDIIILTNEDPYDEDEKAIVEEILEGVKNKGKAEIVMDRKDAIKKAVAIAEKDDIILVTGKGSEPWMCLKGNKKIPWNERQAVLDSLKFNKLIKNSYED